MVRKYPDTYSEGEVAILERIAIIETTQKLHPPCEGLKKLTAAFWSALVIIILLLLPSAFEALAKGGN